MNRRSLFAAVCLAILPTLGIAEPPEPRKRALLVGVSTYERSGFADHALPFAARDVQQLAAELSSGGWDVRLLISQGTRNTARRADILRELDRLTEDVNAGDMLLIAFSGHGQQFRATIETDDGPREFEEAFVCPSDARPGDAATMLGMTDLTRRLGGKGGRNLVLVDACRDDPRRGGVRGVDGNSARRVPSNTAILFSCSARQQSFETNLMYGKNDPRGHGIFFHRVLKGLRGEAKNNRGEVTWARLTEYVTETVNEDALRWFPERTIVSSVGERVVQTPHLVGSIVGRSPVLVAVTPKQQRLRGIDLLLKGDLKGRREAMELFRNAANSGDAPAAYWLAWIYGFGYELVPIDLTEWQRGPVELAEGGYAPAQAYLGEVMISGTMGVERDEAEGQRLLRIAHQPRQQLAEQGDLWAQHNLGWVLEQGIGVKKNYTAALHWYRMAADRGMPVSQSNLGWMYLNGRGVPRDVPEATRWFRKAADRGMVTAQGALGQIYAHGNGVDKNTVEGVRWLRRAAAQGHELAPKWLQELGIEP